MRRGRPPGQGLARRRPGQRRPHLPPPHRGLSGEADQGPVVSLVIRLLFGTSEARLDGGLAVMRIGEAGRDLGLASYVHFLPLSCCLFQLVIYDSLWGRGGGIPRWAKGARVSSIMRVS